MSVSHYRALFGSGFDSDDDSPLGMTHHAMPSFPDSDGYHSHGQCATLNAPTHWAVENGPEPSSMLRYKSWSFLTNVNRKAYSVQLCSKSKPIHGIHRISIL